MIDSARFRFLADALNGTGGFRPTVDSDTGEGTTYLVQYPRESSEKFARRNNLAWYVNDLRLACARFAGYLTKRPVMRELSAPVYEEMLRDCDWRGNSLDTFWARFMMDAKARGCMGLLVDRTTDPGTDRAIPYLVPIAPEDFLTVDLGAQGQVESVEIVTDDGRVRGWDAARWWVREGDQMTDAGDHAIGQCPVLLFSEGEPLQEGEFAQIADMSVRLFNLRSELDEILRAQTFSLLTYQVPESMGGTFDFSSIAAQIGTSNMLTHSGATPAFIAPPDGPARIYLDVITALESKIGEAGYIVKMPNQSETGLSLTLRFQVLNAALATFANRMENLERGMWRLVAAWMGMQEVPEVAWDDDYSLADVATELEVLGAMQAGGFSEETLRAKRRQIVGLDLSHLESEEMDALLAAEEAGSHER